MKAIVDELKKKMNVFDPALDEIEDFDTAHRYYNNQINSIFSSNQPIKQQSKQYLQLSNQFIERWGFRYQAEADRINAESYAIINALKDRMDEEVYEGIVESKDKIPFFKYLLDQKQVKPGDTYRTVLTRFFGKKYFNKSIAKLCKTCTNTCPQNTEVIDCPDYEMIIKNKGENNE